MAAAMAAAPARPWHLAQRPAPGACRWVQRRPGRPLACGSAGHAGRNRGSHALARAWRSGRPGGTGILEERLL